MVPSAAETTAPAPGPIGPAPEARASYPPVGRWLTVVGLSLITALLLAPPLPLGAAASRTLGSGSDPATAIATAAPAPTKVAYVSTVDNWSLGFTEWLPTGFVASSVYPLAVYLHGELGTNGTWVAGGVSGGLASQTWGNAAIASARSHGYILIALNTRTPSGFYVNSAFTGPQERDVLDGIAAEQARRAISQVYLFGDSMGSLGALNLAAQHPGSFAGVGAVAPCTDAFETLQYRSTAKNATGIAESLQPTGGVWPNASASAASTFFYLSQTRFYPQNLSALRLYFVAGGQDRSCPNNSTIFGFQQATNTVLMPTCLTATRVGEPANCTTPLSVWSGNDPQSYLWRFDFVATGGHSGSILSAPDLFNFWQGRVPGGYVCGAAGATPSPCARPGNPTPAFTTQYYPSSVDGTLLSYYEWLPSSYAPTQHYPLLLYLHGKGYQGNSIWTVPAGFGSVQAALKDGFIVVSLNTRNPGGFYVNSPFTGPEEQDALDAITFEKALRPVSSLYLYGFSMGTMGAISIASHHPGLVKGIGLVAPCTDLYEVQSYKLAANRSSDLSYFLNTTGGYLANQSTYADAETYYLSSMRFYPQNLSTVKLYVAAGGQDQSCPNNPAIWGFQEANHTLLNSTCLAATNLSEPAQCTVPFATLAQRNPAHYHFRYVFEPLGIHTLALLDPTDLLEYLLGRLPDGTYWSSPGGLPFDPDALPG